MASITSSFHDRNGKICVKQKGLLNEQQQTFVAVKCILAKTGETNISTASTDIFYLLTSDVAQRECYAFH
jgi:hypothetical protein